MVATEWPINPAWIVLILLALVLYGLAVRIVPQQRAFIVERLGRYHATLTAGLNFIIPFVDRIQYRHTLKEQALDIPEQICITKDNVQVGVDGVLFLRVVDAQRASYGIGSYLFAITQLAQTTLRSEVGKITLDRTFEERSNINLLVVTELDKATEPWGVKVLRYEIKNINPPKDVLGAMEKQMRAEREKRAVILASEGERDAKINRAEGDKQQVIKQSEATKQQQINVAQGQAEGIREVASATAQAVRQVAEAIAGPGGMEATNLRVAEQWVAQFGHVAKETNTLILPANFGDMASLIAAAMSTIKSTAPREPRGTPGSGHGA
jgi:regulator of protease activity HflC (stomatin/prohibitin superfamily)